MATGAFPEDPGGRKVVVVLKETDIERCSYEPGAAQALLDDESYVLPFPLRPVGAVSEALQNIIDAGLARPGAILVQSPFDTNSYEETSQAPQRFAIAKHMYFSALCMHLGATEVAVEQIDMRTLNGTMSVDMRGERLGASVHGAVESDALQRFRAQMNLRDEFVGGAPDYGAAERLLRRTGLLADPNMRTLLEMRRESTNAIVSRRLVLSLSSEAKSNLGVVGRLHVPAFVTLSADYKKVVQEQHDYTLTVTVRF